MPTGQKKNRTSVGLAVIEQMEADSYRERASVPGKPRKDLGLPAKYRLPDNLMERFVAFMSDDNRLELYEEISILRTFLSGVLDDLRDWQKASKAGLEEGKDLPEAPIDLKGLTELIENIGKMVERQHRMMYSANNLVTLEAAAVFALSVAALVNKFVKDPEERQAVLEGVRQIMTNGAGFDLDLVVARKLINPIRGDFNAN
jgi:hypothetical protein